MSQTGESATPPAETAHELADRLRGLAHNTWLYPEEREKAKRASHHDSYDAQFALAASLELRIRERIQMWRNTQ